MDDSLTTKTDTVKATIEDKYYFISIIAFFSIAAYFLLRCPIFVMDTDMWYHLNGGRYFFENFRIPESSFFSFIEPEREWNNYYWLFQVFVYSIHHISGYYGLVIFRAIVFLLTIYFIYKFLAKDNTEYFSHRSVIFIMLIFYGLAIQRRDLNIRPHLISYFFIVVFLYILEHRRDRIWLLPVISIFWYNLHGTMYPVTMLIIFSYLVDIFIDSRRKQQKYPDCDPFRRWCIIISMFCVFITPHGFDLLETPFQFASLQYMYTGELKPLSLNQLFNIRLLPINVLPESFHFLLIIYIFISIILLAITRRIRIGRIIVIIGATYLLTKYYRFMYVFILLSLPVVYDSVSIFPNRNNLANREISKPFLYSSLIVLSCIVFINVFTPRPMYPFSRGGLPAGNIKFLNFINVGGNVLNTANHGGYWQWALNRDYKIYIDMQTILFRDEDIFVGMNMFQNKDILNRILTKYSISFLAVPTNIKSVKEILKSYSDFRIVFFDGSSVIYANRRILPDIVSKHELRTLDPYVVAEIDYDKLSEKEKENILIDSEMVYKIDKNGLINTGVMCNILIKNGDLDRAQKLSDEIIRNYPESFHGYALKAQVMFGRGMFEEAARYNELALRRGKGANIDSVYRNLYLSLAKLKQHKKAYRVLSKNVNPFKQGMKPEAIYEFGLAAALAGKVRQAAIIFRLAEIKTPPDNIELKSKILKIQKSYDIKSFEY